MWLDSKGAESTYGVGLRLRESPFLRFYLINFISSNPCVCRESAGYFCCILLLHVRSDGSTAGQSTCVTRSQVVPVTHTLGHFGDIVGLPCCYVTSPILS